MYDLREIVPKLGQIVPDFVYGIVVDRRAIRF